MIYWYEGGPSVTTDIVGIPDTGLLDWWFEGAPSTDLPTTTLVQVVGKLFFRMTQRSGFAGSLSTSGTGRSKASGRAGASFGTGLAARELSAAIAQAGPRFAAGIQGSGLSVVSGRSGFAGLLGLSGNMLSALQGRGVLGFGAVLRAMSRIQITMRGSVIGSVGLSGRALNMVTGKFGLRTFPILEAIVDYIARFVDWLLYFSHAPTALCADPQLIARFSLSPSYITRIDLEPPQGTI